MYAQTQEMAFFTEQWKSEWLMLMRMNDKFHLSKANANIEGTYFCDWNCKLAYTDVFREDINIHDRW